jgi:PIN domain nuclease of toxin-antitoxin system
MKLLLDTHVWLWMQAEPEKIARPIREVLTDSQSLLYLSAASVWEIAIKWSLGKLPLPEEPYRYVPRALQRQGVEGLPVTLAHSLETTRFEKSHRDPFDHLLIAQAMVEGLTLVSADRQLENYQVKVMWT